MKRLKLNKKGIAAESIDPRRIPDNPASPAESMKAKIRIIGTFIPDNAAAFSLPPI